MRKIISDVAEVIDSLHKTPQYQKAGIPMVRVMDVNNSFLKLDDCFVVDEETYKEHSKNHVPQVGDTIITRVGSYGMIAYVDTDKPFCLGQNIAIISPKKDKEFLYYYLLSPYIQNVIYGNSGGSSYKCIGLEEIKKLPYSDEGLDTDKIGKLLYSIDKKIDSNNAINAELESMVKTIYDYWFLQFDFPDENGKPYRSSGGKMVWNEKINQKIPDGWEIKRIGDVLGKVPKTKKYLTAEYKETGKYPIIDQSKKYICGYTNEQENLIEFDDAIVFGDHTKEVKYVNFSFARGADGTQILVSKNEALSNYLLYLQICQMDLVDQGYSRYFKFLKDKNIIVPFRAINDSFMRIVAGFTFKIRTNHIENQELMSLREFLLPLLMNGQVGFR